MLHVRDELAAYELDAAGAFLRTRVEEEMDAVEERMSGVKNKAFVRSSKDNTARKLLGMKQKFADPFGKEK